MKTLLIFKIFHTYCKGTLENHFPLTCQEQNRWFHGSSAVGNDVYIKKINEPHRTVDVKGFPLDSHDREEGDP